MDRLDVDIHQITPIWIAAYAARTCTASEEKSMCPDLADDTDLLKRCIKKGHESVLEHIVFTFVLDGFSRGLLQELARHRMASPSVQSTRWTLKKLLSKRKKFFSSVSKADKQAVEEYIVCTENEELNDTNLYRLNDVLRMMQNGVKNDVLKYALPDAFRTKAVLTINLRSFRNMVKLRTAPNALLEFQWMVKHMVDKLIAFRGYEYFELIEDVYYPTKGE